jgi:hypothetical protein
MSRSPAAQGARRPETGVYVSVHDELLAPSMGLTPVGASFSLFQIVPDNFVEPPRNTAMPSAIGFPTASKPDPICGRAGP